MEISYILYTHSLQHRQPTSVELLTTYTPESVMCPCSVYCTPR